MDTFVDSAWYWARYLDPHNTREPFSREQADRWLPIDVYVGGPEHSVLHLLYFRFWTKVMRERGLCAVDEPAQKLVTQGIVKGRDGEKMSKSKGNVVSPREIIGSYGADTARLFILFAAPTEKDMDWSDEQVEGQYRFLGRLHRLFAANAARVAGQTIHASQAQGDALELRRKTHRTIARVTQHPQRPPDDRPGHAAARAPAVQHGDLQLDGAVQRGDRVRAQGPRRRGRDGRG